MQVSDTISVAANTTTPNLLLGQPEGTLMTRTAVRVLANASATGIRCHYSRGITPLTGQNGAPVNVGTGLAPSAQNGDVIVGPTICQGQQVLRFENTTAGAITITYRYEIPD